jgi:hypothetical protein
LKAAVNLNSLENVQRPVCVSKQQAELRPDHIVVGVGFPGTDLEGVLDSEAGERVDTCRFRSRHLPKSG